MEYCIVTVNASNYYTATSELEKGVLTRCKEGWKPQGGVSISAREIGHITHVTMSQAMIKEDKPHESEERNETFFYKRATLI